MLQVRNLNAYYGKSHVIDGIDLDVEAGQIVSLMGRNGAGRSTTIKAIMGLVQADGSIRFGDMELLGLEPHQIAHCGVGYVPENRDIFPSLSVRNNLLLGVKSGRGKGRWSPEDAYDLFPVLRERADTAAGFLSGGEQQMLAMCRTLMGDPDLVMVDEPTEGLAPLMVAKVKELLLEIARRGASILLVEQKLTIAPEISERLYVMGHGRIVFSGTPAELEADHALRREWMEV
ncbi:ABC transporter ATP-binding protein [Microbaculum marinum]|uniref:ABC transporter ATP-binding protein n=1 Tax=Microbaculum marinum TaxID=1764581 RepID=A0AAW9RAT6_9HYPH